MNPSTTHLPSTVRPTVEGLSWLAGDGSAAPVLELLSDLGWAIVDTPEANVHCTSPDGRAYVGWLPEDPAAWKRDIVWLIRVQPAHTDAWEQGFGPDTPSEAVAGFLTVLVAKSGR